MCEAVAGPEDEIVAGPPVLANESPYVAHFPVPEHGVDSLSPVATKCCQSRRGVQVVAEGLHARNNAERPWQTQQVAVR